MKYDFDEVIDRHGTFSMKWDCPSFHVMLGLTERFDADTIPIHTADMDFRCAKPIQDAVMRVAKHNIYGYTGAFPSDYGMTYFDAVVQAPSQLGDQAPGDHLHQRHGGGHPPVYLCLYGAGRRRSDQPAHLYALHRHHSGHRAGSGQQSPDQQRRVL